MPAVLSDPAASVMGTSKKIEKQYGSDVTMSIGAALAPSQALAEYEAALDRLIEASTNPLTGLVCLDHQGQTDFLVEFERIRNRMGLVDNAIVNASNATDLPDFHHKRVTADMLTDLLRLDPHVAAARVRVAKHLSTTWSPTGEPIPPRFAELAARQAAGEATGSQLDRVVKELLRLDKVKAATDEQRAVAEVVLAGAVPDVGPRDLGGLAARIRDHIDPDGQVPDDDYNSATRRLNWGDNDDGSVWLTGRFTAEAGEKVKVVLEPLARLNESPDELDLRSAEQRRHDALETVLDRTLRAGDQPSVGGVPATVLLNVSAEDLTSGTGSVELGSGQRVSTQTAKRMTDEASIVSVLFAPNGEVLDQGRKCRLATTAQTYALIARDKGCSFPGCTVPPQWAQRHHITSWLDGGLTDINNLTLVCHFHHHNFGRLGWSCRMIDGLPHWIPPEAKDPSRIPRLNLRLQRMRI